MNNEQFEQYSPEKELASLPINYTKEMALINYDIIYDQIASYNVDRFLEFIDNFNKKIPDRVRITTYGVDGPAVTSILQTDGNIINYTADTTRIDEIQQYYSFYGYQIVSNIYERAGVKYEIYYLITTDNKYIQIFTVILEKLSE